MKSSYDDIRERIPEKPKWFDANGVPRYDKFHPDLCPNIYAEEVALLKIACQACHEIFLVEMHWGAGDIIFDRTLKPLHKGIESGKIHYGDPPRGCCLMGATMGCEDLEVLQFWKMDSKCNWQRNKKYERELQNA